MLEKNMTLKELREEFGSTQTDIAEATGISQSEVSRAELRTDHRMSKVRRYIEALGGRLDIYAVIGKKRIRLKDV